MNNKKLSLLFILIAVLSLLGIVSFTIAYFSSKTSFDNLFSSAYYKTRAVETFTSPDDWIPGSTTSKQLVIKNDGTINVKARVCISEEWISANNDNLPLMQNNESAAIINLANTSDWTLKKNCYEYNNILEPGDETNSFMESVTFNPNIVPDRTCSYINNGKTKHCESSGDGYDNATYILTLTVETIQAEVADEIWDEDKGTLYGIVKNDYKSNSGYAALYTGEHKD